MPSEELPQGDPRILESPLEASLELADQTGRRLPELSRRSRLLLVLGAAWSIAVMALAILTGLYLADLYVEGSLSLTTESLVLISLTLLFIPTIGLGLTMLMLAFKERQFLPFLEKTSGALAALEGKPAAEPDKGQARESEGAGGPLAGILGEAIAIGKLVPTVERMAGVARAVLAVLLFGLGYLLVLVILGTVVGGLAVELLALQLAVFAFFVGPSILLFQGLSRDVAFYRYYSRRHRALSETAALGPPAVPAGRDHLERFDRYLRSGPHPPGKAEEGPGGPDPPFTRLYHGAGAGAGGAVVVKVFPAVPDREALDHLLAGAKDLGRAGRPAVSRAVALVAAEAVDLDDSLYEHIIELGRATPPGGCALQLAMEVDGTYSLVPYIAT